MKLNPSKENSALLASAERLVSVLSEEDVRRILTETAENDPGLEIKLRMNVLCKLQGEAFQNEWELLLNGVTNIHSNQEGYVDADNSQEYLKELVQFVTDGFDILIDGERSYDAVRLVGSALMEVSNSASDNSNGFLAEFLTFCKSHLELSVILGDDRQNKASYEWLKALHQNDIPDHIKDVIKDVLNTSFNDKEYLE